jgi:hypothetical protein
MLQDYFLFHCYVCRNAGKHSRHGVMSNKHTKTKKQIKTSHYLNISPRRLIKAADITPPSLNPVDCWTHFTRRPPPPPPMVRAPYDFWTGNLMGPGGDQDVVWRKRFLTLSGNECLVHGLARGLRISSENPSVEGQRIISRQTSMHQVGLSPRLHCAGVHQHCQCPATSGSRTAGACSLIWCVSVRWFWLALSYVVCVCFVTASRIPVLQPRIYFRF